MSEKVKYLDLGRGTNLMEKLPTQKSLFFAIGGKRVARIYTIIKTTYAKSTQAIVLIGGSSRGRTEDLLIKSQNPLINNNLPQHSTIMESESYSDSPVAVYCRKLPFVTEKWP